VVPLLPHVLFGVRKEWSTYWPSNAVAVATVAVVTVPAVTVAGAMVVGVEEIRSAVDII
jgi:hypothetical protein